MPRPSQRAELIASLRAYIASAEGDRQSGDSPAPRDTPGARAARNVEDANTGQRKTPVGCSSRTARLPQDEQAILAQAGRLLELLARQSAPDRLSPGEGSSAMAGGRPSSWGRAA